MGGMFDTKTDKANRKIERTKKEENERKKSRTTVIIILAVLAVVSAVAIFLNSNYIRRTVPVVTIDGVSFSTTEFEFFFNSEYMEYMQMMSQFQGMGIDMPLDNRPLSRQPFPNSEDGETWADHFTNMALMRMANIVSIYNAARAAGFELSAEQQEEIDDELSMLALQAMFNQFPTAEMFLQQMFGNSMNEATYRKIMEFTALAGHFSEHMRESLNYTQQELADYYAENRDDLDVFAYRLLYINPESVNREDFDTEEVYDEAVQAAVADAHKRAADIITEGIETSDEFVAVAQREYGETSDWIGERQQRMGENLDAAFKDWLMDDSRAYGDITSIDNESNSLIVFFDSRNDNSYKTAGMRQILILREAVDPEEFPLGEEDPEYIAAFQQADNEARERAEQVYSLFINAGATESALIDLMEEHSDDTTPGGEYTEIAKFSYQSSFFRAMQVVPEIEEFLFDDNRNVGDSELIYTSAFGYHLVYFTGLGTELFELIADDRMRTEEHTEWQSSLIPGEPVRHFAFILVQV